MLKVKTLFCCLFVTLACFFINSSSAVDYTPTTADNRPLLNQCWDPGSSVWREKSLTRSGQAHCKIENIVIQAFRQAWLVHEPLNLNRALLNSPLSGKSAKRGRSLLTFAAFNGFRKLALWGVLNGSNINQGDADQVTFLGTAIEDAETYMVDFAFFYLKADPNVVYGKQKNQITALRDMVNHQWPVDSIKTIIEDGAVVRDQSEFEVIQNYFIQMAGADQRMQLKVRELMHTLYLAGSLVNPDITQKPNTTYTDMLKEMDRRILYAIKHGQLTQEDMDSFMVHGRSFYHFLAFNGFNQTIKHLLRYWFAHDQAKEVVGKRDDNGYDMLLAAIHANNPDTINEILEVSKEPVHLKVPAFEGYKNKGEKPLDLAREWRASPKVIKILINNGATPLVR